MVTGIVMVSTRVPSRLRLESWTLTKTVPGVVYAVWVTAPLFVKVRDSRVWTILPPTPSVMKAVLVDLTAVQVTTGVLALRGASSTQSISGTTLFDTLLVDKSAGTASLLASASINTAINLRQGTFNGGTGTITLLGSNATPFLLSGGTFVHGGGTVTYTVNNNVSVASTTFNNLVLSPPSTARTYSLNASTTAAGTTSVNASTTLAVGTNTLTAVGLITNTGLITEGVGGKIVHTRESLTFTNSSGVTQTSYTTPGSVFVQVQDSNRNLDGTLVETMTIPVTMAAGAGSDSETLTLTETGVATGIFFSSSTALVTSSAVSIGNSQFEITATGIGTATYTDNQDAADTGATTATMTASSSGSSSSSGGGGGLGSSGSPALPPLTTQQQSYLQNLLNLNIAIHTLVKLPSDNNDATQEDTAVYYIGADGMRHAFPNSKVYFTWYANFDGVQLIGSTQLASIPLGKNVTYKPGVKMVKFTTLAKVYAVAKGGVLRWVISEAVATELYGSNWNTKIDDISDAFYQNYTFGADVNGLSDFNPTTVEASVMFPSDSLQM